ncbi:MAG: MFS transporter [Candidatus Methanoperedens sp.]|jgi:EmrB/QacA subfamily drug resistance transporter|nr:MFS transporter [Candidatus Methanoperedens sp.]
MDDRTDNVYKWRAMFVVSIGVFMATLDGSIVNVALPTLTRHFDTGLSTIQWVLLSYLLTITTLLLTLGRLSDMYGKKPIFSAGLLIFTIGSGLCSLSVSSGQLIAFRVVQGIGAAMLMANGPAIVTQVFPPTERGKALGLIGTVVSIGSMTGPALGGFLIDWLGWQSIFYINIPVGVFGTVYAMKILRPDELHRNQTFDITGAVLMFISVMALMLGITQGQEIGWDSPIILGLLTLFIFFLGLFLINEKRVKMPMIELSLFRNKPFLASNISGFLSFVAMFAVILLMPYYMEDILGYSTKHVGLALMAVPLIMALVAPLSGWLYDKTNSPLLSSFGMAITALSLFLISGLDSDSGFTDIILRLGLVGLGMGLFQSPNNSIIMGSVPPNRLGIASGMLSTVRNLGMVTGIAVSGAVFTRSLHLLEGAGIAYETAFIGGFHDVFLVSAVICTAGIFTSLVRGGEKPDRKLK